MRAICNYGERILSFEIGISIMDETNTEGSTFLNLYVLYEFDKAINLFL